MIYDMETMAYLPFYIKRLPAMNPKLKCIMLIDDDLLTNFLNKIIIDQADITNHVERCASVEIALAHLTSGIKKQSNCALPELIFLDIYMGGGSGWKFIEYYKLIKDDFLSPPIIIMLTGVGDARVSSIASSIPEISEFHHKPLTREILKSIIKNHFISQ